MLETIASYSCAAEPPLVLNRHCPACDFRSRCYALAVERDDLSLLGGITAKQRSKYQEKGISTITQLSYGYRPRWRRRVMSTAAPGSQPVKHDYKLKALAIKKPRTHIVGSPSLSMKGTPVFMDVEGIPNRDIYCLIGFRYEGQGRPVRRSFWASGSEDECNIWRECIRALKEIDSPCIVHYGAYETRFLKQMKDWCKLPDEDIGFVNQMIERSLNLLAVMYGTIYFPTYSNGLKEIARWLGFEWTWQQASGNAAMLLRRWWELPGDEELRCKLFEYNMDDCRAAEIVFGALTQICGNTNAGESTNLEHVNVASLEVDFTRTFGKFPSALPDFEKINSAAYWDYQRSRVYLRTDKTIRRSVRTADKPRGKVKIKGDCSR
jgi:predicted RecB family nuclease